MVSPENAVISDAGPPGPHGVNIDTDRITPHKHDVLFGRGACTMSHPGNKQLRTMVQRHRRSFVAATMRHHKRQIAAAIIREIQKLEPPGRFLREDPRGLAGGGSGTDETSSVDVDGVHSSVLNKAWICADPDMALTKVMHLLREKETGRLEIQAQQEQLEGREGTSRHPLETRIFGVDSLTTQLPQSMLEVPSVIDSNITNSTVMALGIFSDPNTQTGLLNKAEVSEPCKHTRENSTHKVGLSGGLPENGEITGSCHQGGSGDLDEEIESFLHDFSTPKLPQPLAVFPNSNTHPTDLNQVETFDQILYGTCRHSSEDSNHKVGFGRRLPGELTSSRHPDPKRSGDPDEKVELFLRDFSSRHDNDEFQLKDIPMQEWISKSNQDMAQGKPSTSWKSLKDEPDYIGTALSIALKLTECLIDAEKDERKGDGNPIPLASIIAGHVIIGTGDEGSTEGFARTAGRGGIERVWVMSCDCTGDRRGTGRVVSRLFALGAVLYELFSRGEAPLPEEDVSTADATSICSIQLNDESNGSYFSKKKKT